METGSPVSSTLRARVAEQWSCPSRPPLSLSRVKGTDIGDQGMTPDTITLRYRPRAAGPGSLIDPIRVICGLGALRPNHADAYGVLQARLLLDRMGTDDVTVTFDLVPGAHFLAACAANVAFEVMPGPGDVAADDVIHVEIGLRRLQAYANAGGDEA